MEINNEPPEEHSKKRYTLEEFLEMERSPNVQYQYHNGEIWEVKEAAVVSLSMQAIYSGTSLAKAAK